MDDILDKNSIAQHGQKMLKEESDLMSEVACKLDTGCMRLEQCAFDSINTTDQVLLKLQDAMELMSNMFELQNHFYQTVESTPLFAESEAGEKFVTLLNQQMEQMQSLEYLFHQVAEAGVEANDAAHSIEAAIVEQTDQVMELVKISSKMLEN